MLLFLAACTYVAPTNYDACPMIEVAGQCDAGPLCVSVSDDQSAAVAYAWQCGGSGNATDPGDADDCIEAETFTLGDPSGDQVCTECSDLDGDGPSEATPWTYITLGVWDCAPIDTAG